ncbi:Type II/IV secretion system protein [Granulicella rosea]|uniref:Type II/IV secretion system protein n=1 Tax=Granulicella rosea TaxID=474952 RepID=A0A239K0S9_9BACT|nr:Type II/IV secretion system protein [Granulicella rosea]
MSHRSSFAVPRTISQRKARLMQFSSQQLMRAMRLIAPTLVAMSFAGVAHAQGTMDFSGAQTLMGTFKTTLLIGLLDHVPQNERLLIIEQPAELKVSHPNSVRWEAVDAIPGQIAVTPSELLAAALRHRPDRIIMGEIRNECGYDLLQAMNTCTAERCRRFMPSRHWTL